MATATLESFKAELTRLVETFDRQVQSEYNNPQKNIKKR